MSTFRPTLGYPVYQLSKQRMLFKVLFVPSSLLNSIQSNRPDLTTTLTITSKKMTIHTLTYLVLKRLKEKDVKTKHLARTKSHK